LQRLSILKCFHIYIHLKDFLPCFIFEFICMLDASRVFYRVLFEWLFTGLPSFTNLPYQLSRKPPLQFTIAGVLTTLELDHVESKCTWRYSSSKLMTFQLSWIVMF
jgi:hypothetical protein